MVATTVYVPRVSSHCLLSLWKSLQDQQVGLTQDPFKLLLLPWVLEHVRFCVCPLRIESLFSSGLWDSWKPHWPSKPNVPSTRLGWGAQHGVQILYSLGRTSAIVIILLFVGCLPKSVGLTILWLCPSYSSLCGSIFIFLVEEDLFW